MVAQPDDNTLVLRRNFDASPATVYQAWTSPEAMRQWLRPTPDFSHNICEIDLCVGGKYRIGFQSPEGQRDTVAGEFQEIEPNERLVYTWIWEQPHDYAGVETQVTVEFNSQDNGTELVLTHRRFAVTEMRDHHSMGWSGALDQLVEFVSN
jgi:uncharacterized protein YndB with AHSA1/START domain